jgi:hypothetical protein
MSQIRRKTPAAALPQACRSLGKPHLTDPNQLTPSFFCRLDDDVVYWNTSRLSG